MPISSIIKIVEFVSGLSVDILVLLNLVFVGLIIFVCWASYRYLCFFQEKLAELSDDLNKMGRSIHKDIDELKLEQRGTKSIIELIKKDAKLTLKN